MPKSVSGPLRMGIGPAKGRLQQSMENASVLVRGSLPTTAVERKAMSDEISMVLPRLESQVQTLSDANDRWMQLISELEEDVQCTEEETLYNDTAYSPDGFMNAVLEAREMISVLHMRFKCLDDVPSNNVTTTQPSVATSNDSATVATVTHKPSVKLPKLQLPVFNGNYLEWDNFWQMFKTNIHDTHLAKVEKFGYLLGQLDGNALATIGGISVTYDNYETAVTILQSRYERPARQLVGSYYSQLKRLATSTNKVGDLQRTYDACERIFRQLEKAGEELDMNQSLVFDVFSKYPQKVIEKLFETGGISVTSTLSDVRISLLKHIKHAESLSEIFEELKPFVASPNKDTGPKTIPVTSNVDKQTSALTSTDTTKTSSAQISNKGNKTNKDNTVHPNPCYFCNGSHFNAQCQKYQSADSRYERLTELERCTRCFGATHKTTDCRASAKTVRCFFCQSNGDHRSAVFQQRFGKASSTLAVADIQQSDSKISESSQSALLNSDESALLLTALTTAINPNTGHYTQVRLVLDSGSHRTYISDACAGTLNLTSKNTKTVNVAIFGTRRTLTVKTQVVDVAVKLRDGSLKTMQVNTTPVITGGSVVPDRLPAAAREWLETMKNELADDFTSRNGRVDILVGSDYFWEFISGPKISTSFGIYMIPSTVGLLLSGRYQEDDNNTHQTTLLCLTERAPCFQVGLAATETRQTTKSPDMEEFWELEKIGISDNPLEDDDAKALDQFNSSVYLKEGRYHVKWPWRAGASDLPTNYQLSLGRLRSLHKRLSTNDDVRTKYHAVIEDQKQKGVIEEVRETHPPDHPVHYLPHHPVVRPSSATTKVRVVYEASAKSRADAKSLNECLFRGPVILPDLCAVLMRFRLNPIPITADIENAFLQMALQPEDRDVTRFIWLKDPAGGVTPENTVVLRFCRVPFGVNSSPFLLGATVQHHLNHWGTPTATMISENIYVDNFISTVGSPSEISKLYPEAKEIFRAAGMNLTEWSANASNFETVVPQEDRSSSTTVKVLGLQWDTNDDTLQLKEPGRWVLSSCPTKREILQAVASIFDPLGLFQPVTLEAKIFLRDLWLHNRQWDEPLDADENPRWQQIHERIGVFWSHRMPRHLANLSETSQLIVFCDASANAYATAVYLRTENHYPKTNLLFSKSRLSPMVRGGNAVSIPRLELLGVTIGSKAAKFARNALKTDNIQTIVYTDSSCVLTWLQTSKLLSTFVSNRIRDIKLLRDAEFRHIRSEDNPADLCTRGVPGNEIANNSFWWHGPAWLEKPFEEWPVSKPDSLKSNSDISSEYKGQPLFHTILAGEAPQVVNPWTPFAISSENYSSYRRLLRVTALCLKFLKMKLWSLLPLDARQRNPLSPVFNRLSMGSVITAVDIAIAGYLWVKSAQLDAFSDAKTAIVTGKRNCLVQQLNLKIDDQGIIRCYGRLQFADIRLDAIQPKLLPKKHRITSLIIQHIHQLHIHSGVAHTLSQIRREYWIPSGRASVRREITRCVVCRKYNGPPLALPRMPPWPRERLARSKPFQFTGLDYLGPVTVLVNEETQKVWVCLFTCLAVRAVHLEWVTDCSAQSFVECLSRFTSRRGCPEEIISDNAPQFRTAKLLVDRDWHSVMTDEIIASYASNRGIGWKFTTELAPWQGGFYERLVGLVKKSLKVIIGRRLLKWDQFATVLSETESIINCRPLTYVYEDFSSGYVLRPCDFMTELPTGITDEETNIRPEGGEATRQVIRYWNYSQRRLNLLWERWYDDYLLSLRERGHMDHRNPRGARKDTPFLGQVVLVKTAGAPRGTWKLAKVTKLVTSADNATRSVELLLPNGVTVRRSVSHVYPMELPPVTDAPTKSVVEPTEEERVDTEAISEPSANIDMVNDDDDDAFSGFSESDVLGYQRLIDADVTDDPRHRDENTRQALHDSLNADVATLAFVLRQ